MRQILLIVMVTLVAACAGTGKAPEGDRVDMQALYQRHADAPEPWVRYTSIRNWWAVGLNSVVFELNRSRHYLVDLVGPCSMDLDTMAVLRVVHSRPNMLSEFDEVIIGGQTCQIQSIQRLDYEAVQAELERNGASEPQKRDEVTTDTREDQSSGGM